MAEHILVVDDEREIADLVELYLTNEGFTVQTCYTAEEALRHIGTVDLAILDLMLPGVSGLSLCRTIRKQHTYPIIMLTAKDTETDQITGLTLGADDYITKPFRPLALVARVKAQLRRYKKYGGTSKEDSGVFLHAGLVLDIHTHECSVDGTPLSLTPTEFSILRILFENKGKVVSSEGLFHALWGDAYYSKSHNTITVHIRHLREKLGDTADHPNYIKTVWGVGYKIEG